ncbi:beta-galactosidase [Abditibacteriota bacterium]|nr:beta-galactosidase [Abditibacteriota bacterium]
MLRVLLMLISSVMLGGFCAQAQNTPVWKPANGPLMTRWAKEVSPTNALPEYPRPTLVRDQWQNLNGLWEYAISDKNAARPATFDGQILVPYPVESALSGVMKPLLPEQGLWYRRQFTIPTAWTRQKVLLHFGAVDWETEVFLNGKSLGSHRGGYDAFTLDLTNSLNPNGPNELVVSVTDPTDASWEMRGKQTLHPGGAAYTATSGIWQTVWLEPVGPSSIESLKMVPDLKAGALHLSVSGRTPPGTTNVEVTVSTGTTKVATAKGVLGDELNASILDNLAWYKATSIATIADINVPLPNAHLWTPTDPFLYDLTVELKDSNGATLDTVRSYFGMRSLEVRHDDTGNTRLMFNGKPIMLLGALDQGFWPDGIYTAPTDEALRFDVEAAKRLGLTAIRKHIKIEPERYYYWCDKLGLLVTQDLPSGYAGDPFTDSVTNPEGALHNGMEMRTLIQQRWNHPSIIMWNMFNEGWGQHDTLYNARWAKQLDPSRLINEASGFPHHGGGDVYDVHGGIPPKSPTQISLDSETMGVGLATPGHAWPGTPWAGETYDAATGGGTDGNAHGLYPLDAGARLWYTRQMRSFYRAFWASTDRTGSSGDFKVQLYDLENETNGLLSYDRELWKVEPDVVATGARGEALPSNVKYLLPTSQIQQTTWRYTTDKPADNWMAPKFDDTDWKTGPSGFGGEVGTGKHGTPWETSDIWLRQTITLASKPTKPMLRLIHDEDVQVFINGVLAMREGGFTTAYDDYELDAKAAATLKAGPNTIAVHCKQTTGGQGIDVGLVDYGK